MRKQNTRKIWFTAFLMIIFMAGCGDPDHSTNPGLTSPTVISVAPPDAATGVCSNTIVTATFSEAMNPSSIDSTTFTLTGPGSAPVAGQISYDGPSHTAIFTPSSSLALSTVYTATITNGVQDLFGNRLGSDFV